MGKGGRTFGAVGGRGAIEVEHDSLLQLFFREKRTAGGEEFLVAVDGGGGVLELGDQGGEVGLRWRRRCSGGGNGL